MDTRPIGLFDSGVGGLSVLKELMTTLPNEEFIYLGDIKNFPYGNKSSDIIIELTKRNIEFLISKNVKMIIIACGTATSQALDAVKDQYNIPIIGIINPTIDYLRTRHKDNEVIGIIATNGTIKSGVWEKRIIEDLKNVKVINKKAPLLAIMAEEGWTNNKVAEYTIKEYMKDLYNVDKLVLGCTHYPIFEELIKKELPDNVEIINTGKTVSIHVNKFLKDNNLSNINQNASFKIFLTDKDDNFKEVAKQFINEEINDNQIEIVE